MRVKIMRPAANGTYYTIHLAHPAEITSPPTSHIPTDCFGRLDSTAQCVGVCYETVEEDQL